MFLVTYKYFAERQDYEPFLSKFLIYKAIITSFFLLVMF